MVTQKNHDNKNTLRDISSERISQDIIFGHEDDISTLEMPAQLQHFPTYTHQASNRSPVLQVWVGNSPKCGCGVFRVGNMFFTEHIQNCQYAAYLHKISLLSPLQNEAKEEMCDDLKKINKSMYEYKKPDRMEHIRNGVRLVKEKLKKLHKKKTRAGFRKLINESGEFPLSYIKLKFSSIGFELFNYFSVPTTVLENNANRVFNMLDFNTQPSVDYQHILTTQIAYFSSLCVCTTWSQIAAATFQMFVSIGGSSMTSRLVDFLYECINSEESDLKNEGFAESLDTIKGSLLNMSNVAVGLDTIPMYKYIANAFALAALIGVVRTQSDNDDGVIMSAYKSWVASHVERHRSSNLFALLLETMAFATQFMSGLIRGDTQEYFRPLEVYDKALRLLSLRINYRNGTLDSVGTDFSRYFNAVGDTIKLLDVAIKGMHPAAANSFQRVKRELYALLCEMTTRAAHCNLRTPAPCIVLYGDSQIGKTALMYMIIHMMGDWLGFSTNPEDIHYDTKGDKFDSGFTADKNVIVVDDASAEKAEYTDFSKGGLLLRLVNAVPYKSLQAEIDKKGVIPLNHKMSIMTTNVPDLQINTFFEHPMAAFNRMVMVHVRVRDEYCISGTKKIDGSKMTGIVPNPMAHEFQFYTYKQIEDSKASASRQRTSGYTRVVLTEWMSTKQFFARLKSQILDFDDKGKSYISQIREIQEIPICPECGLWQDDEKQYCVCHLKLQDEALEFISRGRTIIMTYILVWLRYLPTYIYLPSFIPVVLRRNMENWFTGVLFFGGNMWLYCFLKLRIIIVDYVLFVLWLSGGPLLFLWFLFSSMYAIPGILGLLWFVVTLSTLFTLKRTASRNLANMEVRDAAVGMSHSFLQMGMSIAIAFNLAKFMRSLITSLCATTVNQGNIMPTCRAEVDARNVEVNPWLPVKPIRIPKTGPTVTMSSQDFAQLVERNLSRAMFTSVKGTTLTSNVFAVAANVILVPKHTFELVDVAQPFTIVRNTLALGTVMRDVRVMNYDEVHSDLVALTISRASTFRDVREFFPDELFKGNGAAFMLSRDTNGIITKRSLYYNHNEYITNETTTLPGSRHVCDIPTNKGDCGSPVFILQNPQKIVGFHCAGTSKLCAKQESACFAVSKPMLLASLKRLQQKTEGAYRGDPPMFVNEMLDMQYGQQQVVYTTDFHERECVNFVSPDLDLHAVEPIGSAPLLRYKTFSEVKVSLLSPFLEKQGLPLKWGKPQFNSNRNHAANFQELCKPMVSIPVEELDLAIQDYLGDIVRSCEQLELRAQPLTMDVVINGDPSKKFVKSLNKKTSSGLGLKSPKSLHLDEVIVNGEIKHVLKEYVMDEFTNVECMLADDILPHHIYKSALKDEPTVLTKDKVRVFQVCPFTLVLLTRKWTLDVVNSLFSIPVVTEMAQGINCLNGEWDQCAQFLLAQGRNCIEGDFSKYDLRFTGQAIRSVGYVLKKISIAMGYTSYQARMVERVILEISFKMFAYNGTLFNVDGVNPSGVPLTIVINGMFNSIIHRICFYRIMRKMNLTPIPFRSVVHMLTVGDDSVMSSSVPWFNMKTIQEQMVALRMPYTDGHKSAVIKEFFDFSEIQLCKRPWRWEERVRAYVGPLAVDSLLKSMHCLMKSDTLELDIVIQNVDGALRGFARHTEGVFNYYSEKIIIACQEAGISHMIPHMYTSYDEWWDIFRVDFGDSVSSLTTNSDSYLFEDESAEYKLNSTGARVHNGLLRLRPWLKYVLCALITTWGFSHSTALTHILRFQFGQIDALPQTLNNISISKTININISGQEGDSQKNVRFQDSHTSWKYEVPHSRDSTFDAAHTSDQIQDFLVRPVKIFELSWEVGVAVDETFNPWDLYFSDPKVLARIANFKNLTCDLKIKFLINGNPFYHGCLLAAYQPLPANDERTAMTATSAASQIQMSQMPHVYLNPTHSTGGDIVAPFFFYKNAVNVQLKEWSTLGALRIRDIAALNHANGGTNPITVSVFAMAENVKLTMPTGRLFNESDEYGVVSHAAHNVAKVAGHLSDMPTIGPYARATEMVATGLGNLASMMGFSRARKVDESVSMKPRYSANLAVTNVEDNIASLALDAKKELTIDPRVVGLPGEDEMALVPLAMRESYVTTFPWTGTDAVETHLFSTRITPMMGDVGDGSYFLAPSAWVSLPFKYWKGSQNLRFSVISSAYHRGRLRFVWDPNETRDGLGSEYNTAYSTIVDITECNDINIRIGWGADTSYLPVGGLLSLPDFTTEQNTFIVPSAFANGTLSVYVVNELTAPAEPVTPVDILVYSSMCEDFEVACPDMSAFTLTDVTRTEPIFPPVDIPEVPSPDPDPPVPPPEPPTDTITFSDSPPLGAYKPIFQGALSRFSYPYTGTRRPAFGGVPGGFRTSFEQATAGPISITMSIRPPAAGTYTVVGKAKLVGGSQYTDSQTFTYTTAPAPDITFTWNIPATQGILEFEFVAPNELTWLVDKMILPPAIGVYSFMQGFTMRGFSESGTATVDVDQVEATSGDLGVSFILNTSVYYQLDLTDVLEFTNPVNPTGFNFLCNGASGQGYAIKYVYTDDTVSPQGSFFPVPFDGIDGTQKILYIEGPPTAPGKIVKALRMTIINNSSPTALELYSMSFFKRTPLENEGSELFNESEEIPQAPVAEETTVSMGPVCVDNKANRVHFGESVTSWRQCLKRYTYQWQSIVPGSTSILAHDSYGGTEAGELLLTNTRFMEYVSSAYVAKRGGVRVKVLVDPSTSTSEPMYGSIVIARPSDISVRRQFIYEERNFNFCGSTWDPLQLTQCADAEIPYYSNMRFMPARLGADTQAYTTTDARGGRERLWYTVSVKTSRGLNLNVLQSAAEDYSLHFFLCTPAMEIA